MNKSRQHTPIDHVSLGKEIRRARQKKNYTQQELAELVCCSPQHISRLENGASCMSLRRLVHTARILDCPLDTLLKDSLTFHPYTPHTLESRLREAKKGERESLRRSLNYMIMYLDMIRKWT